MSKQIVLHTAHNTVNEPDTQSAITSKSNIPEENGCEGMAPG